MTVKRLQSKQLKKNNQLYYTKTTESISKWNNFSNWLQTFANRLKPSFIVW